jgi:hypothetical protein
MIPFFMQNVATARELMQSTSSFGGSYDAVYGVNKFSDMTETEFRALHLTFRRSTERSQLPLAEDLFGIRELPTEMDWRIKGAVTAVKVEASTAELSLQDRSAALHSCDAVFTLISEFPRL